MAEAKKAVPFDARWFKWGFIALLAILFILGLVIQANMNVQNSTDAELEMRRKMGISDEDKRPLTPMETALGKMGSSVSGVRAEGMSEAMKLDAAGSSNRVKAMLGDPAAEVRVRAIKLLVEYKVPGIGSSIAALMSDANEGVRNAAASSFGNFAKEPGIVYALSSPLSSRDPAVIRGALLAWRSAASSDRRGAVSVITPVLSSSDPAILKDVVDAISSSMPVEELAYLRPYFENIASRFPETEAAKSAASLLEKMNAGAPLVNS